MKYFRVATINTPEVSFDLSSGFISISGISTTINSVDFYRNFINELISFRDEKQVIVLDISLQYFNTSAAKYIYTMLKELKSRVKTGNNVLINWFYDSQNKDMFEMGKDLSSLIEIDFKFHEMGDINFAY